MLQPEGIELNENDFEGPLGPGNPLAAAVRAAREYMLGQKEFDPEAGEPYPMLLVRPEGITAYYAAREAMKSWGGRFRLRIDRERLEACISASRSPVGRGGQAGRCLGSRQSSPIGRCRAASIQTAAQDCLSRIEPRRICGRERRQ